MLPKSINVLGKKYKIKIKEIDPHGSIDRLENKIDINIKDNNENKMRTLFHEIAHAGCWRSGISFGIDPTLEEIIVETMANVFYEFNEQYFGKDWHE